jgi:hypothetical protein
MLFKVLFKEKFSNLIVSKQSKNEVRSWRTTAPLVSVFPVCVHYTYVYAMYIYEYFYVQVRVLFKAMEQNEVRSWRTTAPLISVFSCVSLQVRVLFRAMEQNEKVEYLDLGDNAISDVGISYVADLLQAHI